MTSVETSPGHANVCPYLGLIDDRATHLAYPSTEQVCHALGRPTAADHVKQAQDCLTADHIRCPRYRPVEEPAPQGRRSRAVVAGPGGGPTSTDAASSHSDAGPSRHDAAALGSNPVPAEPDAIPPGDGMAPPRGDAAPAPALVAPARATVGIRPRSATRLPPSPRRMAVPALFAGVLIIVAAGGLILGPRLVGQMGATADPSAPVGGASTPIASILASPAPTATAAVTASATAVPAGSPLPSAPPTGAPAGTSAPTPTTHIVKAGETLTQIAFQYGVTIQALQAANRLTDPNLILTGQTLIIPVP